MGVRTRANTTVTVHAVAHWRCSACGSANAAQEQIKGFGTSVAPGFNANYYSSETQAKLDLQKAIKSMNHADVGRRYDVVDLSGACQKCGNCEPWAQMHKTWIMVVKGLLRVGAVFLGLFFVLTLLMGFALHQSGVDFKTILLASFASPYTIAFIVVGGALIGLTVFDSCRKRKLRNQIRRLPAASLPVLTIPEPAKTPAPPAKKGPMDYTEEELKRLPTWKRVEILKQREQQ